MRFSRQDFSFFVNKRTIGITLLLLATSIFVYTWVTAGYFLFLAPGKSTAKSDRFSSDIIQETEDPKQAPENAPPPTDTKAVQAAAITKPAGYAVGYPTTGAYWGIYRSPFHNYGNWADSTRKTAITDAETQLGRKFDFDRQFNFWDDQVPSEYVKWTSSQGRIPFLSAGAEYNNRTLIQWADIANGSQDVRINQMADGMRNWGKPILFTFNHEPEARVSPNNTRAGCDFSKYNGTTTEFKNAYRHVVEVFNARGASNVDHVFISMSYYANFPNDYRNESQLYPGNDVVEWISSDPYNYIIPSGQSFNPNNWRPFRDKLNAWYSWAAQQNKPLLIAEFGSLEDPGNPARRAQWFAEAQQDIKKSYPKIKGLSYFDSWEWLIFNRNPQALEAFKNWGLDPYYNTQYASTPAPAPAPGGSGTSAPAPAPTGTSTTANPSAPTGQSSGGNNTANTDSSNDSASSPSQNSPPPNGGGSPEGDKPSDLQAALQQTVESHGVSTQKATVIKIASITTGLSGIIAALGLAELSSYYHWPVRSVGRIILARFRIGI